MKTTHILLVMALSFLLAAKALAMKPVSTYTFVNPCQPFGMISPVAGSYGCVSYSATNGGVSDPAGYFTWNFGDGSSATGANVLHCYSPVTVTMVYTVTVGFTSAVYCGPAPTVQNYTLVLNPPAQGQCIQESPNVTLSAKTVTVWAGITIPEIINSYNYGDGTAVQPAYTHTYTTCGNYIIKVKNWDMNAPQDTCYAYAAVNIACASTVTTGIEEHTAGKENVSLFPNPASGDINIISKHIISGIKIVDALGKECALKTTVNSASVSISVAELKAGIYFVKTEFSNGSEQVTKFIKQ